MARIDLNSDLGESFGAWELGDDEAMLDIVTSANVACGFHAGDPSTLQRVCAAAAARGVAIGAHVSYPDLVGFGRRAMTMEPAELRDTVVYQIGALDGFARAAGTEVRYVKPHGALYHAAASDPEAAGAVVAAIAQFGSGLAVLSLPGSAVGDAARSEGVRVVAEAFADRAYLPDGSLVPRTSPGAVLTDVAVVADRVVRLAIAREVVAIDGSIIDVDAESVCVHGDTPGAVELAGTVYAALRDAGVSLQRFVS